MAGVRACQIVGATEAFGAELRALRNAQVSPELADRRDWIGDDWTEVAIIARTHDEVRAVYDKLSADVAAVCARVQEELGELKVARNAGPRGCNRYRVRMTPAGDAPGTVLEPSENKNKPSSSEPAGRPDVGRICDHLADRIEANGSKRPTVTQRWRDAGRRLLDRDGRTVDQVIRAIDWCQDDQFWRANILSMPKLREKYDQLRLAAQRAPTSNGRPEGGHPGRSGGCGAG